MISPSFNDLRSFMSALEKQGELITIDAEVDPRLELAEVHRRVIAAGGPALLFRNVRNSPLSVVTNLFGTHRRVELAFSRRSHQLIAELARLPEDLLPPRLSTLWSKRHLLGTLLRIGTRRVRGARVAEVCQSPARLSELPALTTWSFDGGPFLTLPLVHTQHPTTGVPNLGMYRMQVFDDESTGMHFQIGKGGGFHLHAAEVRGTALPVQVYLGGPPALIMAAIAPLPENVPELLLASLLVGRRLPMVSHPRAAFPLPAGVEVALIGEVRPGERRPEGPFGDHYGYYSLRHDYPVFHCQTVLRRRDAVFPATVVGKPRQEDFYLGDFLQEMLSPLFPLVMPGVRDLWSYGETGYHSLAAAVVQERYRREAMMSAFRILGEGQLSLTKFLLVTDQPIDLRNFKATLEHVLARADLRTDLYVLPSLSMDTLDYSGPRVNEGSKGILLGLGKPRRELPRGLTAAPPDVIRRAIAFCAGCLIVEGRQDLRQDRELGRRIAQSTELGAWPLVVLVDDAERAAASVARFLWTAFTRFEPATDIYGLRTAPDLNHPWYEAPVVIDARLKPGFPDELFCDEATATRVTRRWSEYFPAGQEMGSSDVADLG